MYPWLVAIMLMETFTTFSDRLSGWWQAAALIGCVTMLLVGAATVNRLRNRPLLQIPDDVGVWEILFFLLAVPLLDLLFVPGNRVFSAVVLFITNAVILSIGYVITSYGLFHMLRWGLKQMLKELSGVLTLLARSLPLLLLFATFLFINAEMWQVAHDISWPFYAIVVGTLSAAAVGFVAMRLPTDLLSLERFSSWDEVTDVAHGCYERSRDLNVVGERPRRVPLDRGERLNLLLLMVTAKVVQIVLVGTIIGGFYVAFGLLTVREQTLLQWTATTAATLDPIARFTFLGTEVVLTRELFQVSGFIAAISALQFSVSLVTDDTYRAEFNSDIDGEIREVMAVRAMYLSHVRGES